MSDDVAVGHQWMTYREIAAALGLPSVKAAEARTRRARWRRQPGNDGAARVAVPLFVLEAPRSLQRRGDEPSLEGDTKGATLGATNPPSINVLVAELRAAHERLNERAEELAELREQFGRAEGEATTERQSRERAEAREAAERERAARLEAERERLRDELDFWTAGGPFERAWRALVFRRGR
jgi:hypothetical protein